MEPTKYEKHYTEVGFWGKLKKAATEAGVKVVYAGLILYYAVQSPKTPLKAKIQIYGALGYLILPLDIIPDLIPVVGYMDDLGALMLAVGAVAMNIDSEVKQKAKDKLVEFFGAEAVSHQEVVDVDAHIT
ncbi:YkvA family protein [Paenibacillus agricola]|uniref:DUF1232 domain-containing protein n=1 Tax=Paenibacillus agricola TaxID=2716264 RepID=A0ABX0JB41_9BACL|nr:YkvA family protein [Paenibacillus agricola]NHN32449.1 DUF1232 domain-containing protein [Paenibacillus agricola]